MDQMRSWINKFPVMHKAILYYLGERMRQLMDVATDVTLHSTLVRLAALLLKNINGETRKLELINNLPKEIPVFPLSNFIIFPKTSVPLNIFEPSFSLINHGTEELWTLNRNFFQSKFYKDICLFGENLLSLINKTGSFFRLKRMKLRKVVID